MPEHDSIVLTNARVFDGEQFVEERQDVIVEDGRITKIAASGGSHGPDGIATVDASDSTVAPGFIDCHVHMTVAQAGSLAIFAEPFSLQFFRATEHLAATLRAGVTTARDAGGSDRGVRVALERGIIAGPRLLLAIAIMSQTGGHGDGCLPSGVASPMLAEHPGRPSGVADGPAAVRTKARELFRAGADQIKICSTGGVLSSGDDPRHSQFTDAEIAEIVAEAEAHGSYVMSHAQGTEGIKNALRAGVRSIEHGIYLDDEAIELLLDRGAFLVPTLQAPRAVVQAADAGVPLTAEVVEKARVVSEAHADSIRRAYEAGVQIAMGTDAGVGQHGENLEEIELMSMIGMSPADALKAATSTAADLLRIDDIGRVRAGARADLVLLDGDLKRTGVADIRGRVTGVWQGGVRQHASEPTT